MYNGKTEKKLENISTQKYSRADIRIFNHNQYFEF